jgi:hypothetical protein
MTRPEVNRSWKATDNDCTWSNPRLRRSNSIAWPIRPLRMTNTERSQPESTALITRVTATTVSDVQSPCSASGSDVSMAMPISHGAASAAAVWVSASASMA